MKQIFILKTGDTFEETKKSLGDFEDWIISSLKTPASHIKTIDTTKTKSLPSLCKAKGFIITGSHAMVTEELEWSRRLERYIQKIVQRGIPLFGICYGHQLIAKSLGGKSAYNKKGKEIGTVKIKKLQSAFLDPLFYDIPLEFYGHETHSQSALKLPSGATILAKNHHDKHQAVRFSPTTWGVQFHPEFSTTCMQEYIQKQKRSLKEFGLDVSTLLKGVKNCPYSTRVLQNFEKLL